MKYLINNSKPETIIVNQQREIEYFTESKNGKFIRHRLWIAMHPVGARSDNSLDEKNKIDQYVIRYNLPPQEKLIINYKSDGFVKDYRYTSEQRRDVNYTFPVEHYKHIVDFRIGNDITNQRRYDLLVGAITKVENDLDAETIMKQYGFVDECNEKGETIKSNPIMDKIDKEPMNTEGRKLPTQWENVPREDFVKKFNSKDAPKMEYKKGEE